MKKFRAALISWLPLAIAISGLCFLTLVVMHHSYRSLLNEPQVQMARDAAARIYSGAALETVIPPQLVTIESSLAPWAAVLNRGGTPIVDFTDEVERDEIEFVATSGLLNGQLFRIPPGVLAYAEYYGENRLTWQPQQGVRQAIVVVHIPESEYFVIAGRNMYEAERRIGEMYYMILSMWLFLMAATLAAKYFSVHTKHRRK